MSLFLHFFVLMFFLLIEFSEVKPKINTNYFFFDTRTVATEDVNNEEAQDNTQNKINEQQPEEVEKKIEQVTAFVDLAEIEVDTIQLDQLYKESTLNVSIKYPQGWVFLDQTQGDKLDGVTFWAADGAYNPPPYLHLEVVEKDYFIEKRYLYKAEIENSIVFFNDPEEMEGYVSQTFYFRTEYDEDFQIKLMIKGLNEFTSFKPKLWAIIKSFKFGNSLF